MEWLLVITIGIGIVFFLIKKEKDQNGDIKAEPIGGNYRIPSGTHGKSGHVNNVTKEKSESELYQELDDFMVDFVQSEVDENRRETNTIKLKTTTCALFAAWYFVKNVGVKNGVIINKEQGERFLHFTDSLFAKNASSILDHYADTGNRPPKEEVQPFLCKLYDMQKEKLERYIKAIHNMLESRDRSRFGAELTKEITRDLFGKSFIDISLKTRIVILLGTSYQQ